MTQIGVLENLKIENVTLSHQLQETKHRSIKEKERIAVQLQSIEVLPSCHHLSEIICSLKDVALFPSVTPLIGMEESFQGNA